jgi:hypothetical protein
MIFAKPKEERREAHTLERWSKVNSNV